MIMHCSWTTVMDASEDQILSAVITVADDALRSCSDVDKTRKKAEYDQWKAGGMRSMDLYQHDWFRAFYVKDLFAARSRSQHMVLNLVRDSHVGSRVIQVLNSCQTVCSIGCGPGCDIAGVAAYLSNRHVNYIAVDTHRGWFDYINAFIGRVGSGTCYDGCLNHETVDSLPAADVVVISYAHSNQHTAGFWKKLRKKFALVVVQEVPSTDLSSKMATAGYSHMDYIDRNSNLRHVFYHLKTSDGP